MFEPCAMKVACTVLRRGKREISYLFQLDTLVVHTLNDGGYRLGPLLFSQNLSTLDVGDWDKLRSHPRSEGIKPPAWGV